MRAPIWPAKGNKVTIPEHDGPYIVLGRALVEDRLIINLRSLWHGSVVLVDAGRLVRA